MNVALETRTVFEAKSLNTKMTTLKLWQAGCNNCPTRIAKLVTLSIPLVLINELSGKPMVENDFFE